MPSEFSYYLFAPAVPNLAAAVGTLSPDPGYDPLPLGAQARIPQGAQVLAFVKGHAFNDPQWMGLVHAEFDAARMYQDLGARGFSTAIVGGSDLRSLSLLILIETAHRVFAITAGTAYSRLDERHLEPEFGKDVALNWTVDGHLVQVDCASPGRRGRRRSERLNSHGRVNRFTPTDDLSILKRVGGKVAFGTGEVAISGGLQVRFAGAHSLATLASVCQRLLAEFGNVANRPASYSDLERVARVRDPQVELQQTSALCAALVANSAIDFAVVAPDLSAYQNPSCWFRYRPAAARQRRDWIPLGSWEPHYVAALVSNHTPTVPELESLDFMVRDGDDETIIPALRAFSYLTPVMNGSRYMLEEGGWYQVSDALYQRVQRDVDQLVGFWSPNPALPRRYKSTQRTEEDYNRDTAQSCGHFFLDYPAARPQVHGSPLELCDIFTANGELLCVKDGTNSTAVAVATSQAIHAAKALAEYPSYWTHFIQNCGVVYAFDPTVDPRRFRFVVALISARTTPLKGQLRFKAKLELAKFKREVHALGMECGVCQIEECP